MQENLLSGAHLNNETAAYEYLAALRWPEGLRCVHCQGAKVYRLKGAKSKRVLLKCATCRKQFSATVGTIFQGSHIPLSKWFMAFQLMASSKKGMSALQLQRELWGENPETKRIKGSYRTAWFMCHRVRWAMTQSPMSEVLSGVVEADETYVGGRERGTGKRGVLGPDSKKTTVFAMERGADRFGHSRLNGPP